MFAAWDQPLVNADREAKGLPRPENRVPPVTDGADGEASREGAFNQWLQEMRPRLVQLARRFLWCSHEAEEVAQDALVLAWQWSGRLKDRKKRNAWLYRTTINLCMNRLRKKRSQALPQADLPAEGRAEAGRRQQTDELMDRVRSVIARLPDRQQAALVLREVEGLAYEQIAAILQARPAAVRLLVHRARESVRQMLLRQWPDSFGPDR